MQYLCHPVLRTELSQDSLGEAKTQKTHRSPGQTVTCYWSRLLASNVLTHRDFSQHPLPTTWPHVGALLSTFPIPTFPDVTVSLAPAQTEAQLPWIFWTLRARNPQTLREPIKMNRSRGKRRGLHKVDDERIGNMGNGVGAGSTLKYIPAIKFPV